MSFSDLGLSEHVAGAVADAGYEKPTPIQEQAIPVVLMGRDVLGCAQTGTGKTASFTLPMIDILAAGRAKARMPRSLILCPTRELAAQVADNFERYGKNNALTMALLIGGVAFGDQVQKLDRGVDVLIATPGRLLDHFERGKVLLNDVKILVIDEADRMLDMGFIPDVERIVSLLPRIRQTLFFSATLDRGIRKLADAFLINPKEITVAPPASTADTVIQRMVATDPKNKRNILRALIDSEDVANALIFCNRKRDVGILHRSLVRHGYDAVELHGDMAQASRTETLAKFKAGEARLLVASDVAARGLDIAGLSHVFNFDVPTNAEDYVHRIGRTGRAGKEGRSFTITTREDSKYMQAIIKLINKPIETVEVDGLSTGARSGGDAEEAARPAREAGRSRGRRGTRGGARNEAPEANAEQPEATPEKRTRRRRGSQDEVAETTTEQPEAPRESRPRGRRNTRDDAVEATPKRRERPARESNRFGEKVPPPVPANAPTVGMGDHVPAFLLRSAR